ncbi:MAG: hypothetical protein AB1641_19645 [Thermodesulfobacteriota bacterium]
MTALKNDRNSIGVEIDPDYCRQTARYLKAESTGLFSQAELRFECVDYLDHRTEVREDEALYQVKPARKRLEQTD